MNRSPRSSICVLAQWDAAVGVCTVMLFMQADKLIGSYSLERCCMDQLLRQADS